MKIIEKKIKLEYLKEIYRENKLFEVRKENDVVYEKDDILVLRAIDKEECVMDYAICRITYVLRDFEGLKENYVVLGIRLLVEGALLPNTT